MNKLDSPWDNGRPPLTDDQKLLAEQYYGLFNRWIRSKLKRHSFMQSMLEDYALCSFFDSCRKFDPSLGVPFEGYVTTRLNSAFLECLKITKRREKFRASELPEYLGVHDRSSYGCVARIVDDLPDRERTIIRMKYWGGFDYKQIADAIGMSERHTHKVKRKAFIRLRERLAS